MGAHVQGYGLILDMYTQDMQLSPTTSKCAEGDLWRDNALAIACEWQSDGAIQTAVERFEAPLVLSCRWLSKHSMHIHLLDCTCIVMAELLCGATNFHEC